MEKVYIITIASYVPAPTGRKKLYSVDVYEVHRNKKNAVKSLEERADRYTKNGYSMVSNLETDPYYIRKIRLQNEYRHIRDIRIEERNLHLD